MVFTTSMKIETDKDVGSNSSRRHLILSAMGILCVFAMVGTLAPGMNKGMRGTISPSPVDSNGDSRHLTECPVQVTIHCHGCELKTDEADYSCVHAPNLLGMLLRGGSCAENEYSTQAIQPLSCIDYNEGPPKQGSNEPVYIRVIDETNNEVVFEGTVREGSVYNISNSNDSRLLGSELAIVIFADETLQRPLQSTAFEVTCADEPTTSLLFHVFGSSQIVTSANDAQEIRSTSIPDLTIDIELSNTGTSTIALHELYVRNSLAAEPLDGKVAGITGIEFGGPSGDDVQVSLRLPFPASGESSVDCIVTGVVIIEDGESRECMFASFEKFPISV